MTSKFLSIFSCLFMIVVSTGLEADELDQFKADATRYYDRLTTDYQEIGKQSRELADHIIDSTIQSSILNVDGAFEYTFDRVYGSFQKVQGCLNRHRSLANPILDFISSEPADLKQREAYWLKNYDGPRLYAFSSAMNQIQFTYGDCIGDIQRIRDFIEVMKAYKDKNLQVCRSVEENLEYKNLTDHLPLDHVAIGRLKNDWWRYVPTVVITGSLPASGCPDSIVSNCYSNGPFTIESARNQRSIQNSYERLKAYYPELAAASYLTFLALMNGYEVGTPSQPGAKSDMNIFPKQPDSISHMGEANLIASLVWIAATYITTEQQMKRVRELNSWLDQKEAALDALIKASVISEAEFNEKKKTRCQEQAGFIDERVGELLSYLLLSESETAIRSYLGEVNAIQTWYNSLFLSFYDQGIVDELARNELIYQRDETYKRLNQAKIEADFASIRQGIDGVQQDIARERCGAGISNSTTARNLKRLVNRYHSYCENALSLYAYTTEKIPLQGGTEGKVRCFYDGFDEAVKSITITNDSGYSSRIQAYDEAGSLLFSIGQVSSASQDTARRLQPAFYCSVIGLTEFGTKEDNRLKEGTYRLKADESLGILGTRVSDLKQRLRQKAELIRSKVARCNSTLSVLRKIDLPEVNSCRISGGQL